MNKNIIETKEAKNKAISAFRKYARYGLHKRKLSPFEVYRVISGCCSSESARLDLLAVYDTIRLLSLCGEDEILTAIHAVYFSTASHRIRKSEISEKIRRYAVDFYCDERTVYRRLTVARKYYSALRQDQPTV